MALPFSSLAADTAHRFRAVSAALESHGAAAPAGRLLDVGGYPCTFARGWRDAHPGWSAITLDTPREDLPDYIAGTGAQIPFADGEFDAVVSIDTLEHVPPSHRPGFLSELSRVCRGTLVIAAPFSHPNHARAEAALAAAHRAALGKPHPWLQEHVDNGLPDLAASAAAVGAAIPVEAILGSYDLSAWVAWQGAELLKRACGDLDAPFAAFDAACAAADTPPAAGLPYRHLIVARRGSAGGAPVPRYPDGAGASGAALAEVFAQTLARLSAGNAESPSACVDARLREALAAAEQEIERLRRSQNAPLGKRLKKLLGGS